MLMPRHLIALVDLPYVTATGRVVTKPGYDPETCLYLDMPRDREVLVPEAPTSAQVRAALATGTKPWRAYAFGDADSAAGMVSAVVAAVVRAGLDLCPAYLFDASQQGSGKTKAASALGALLEGQRPAVTPFAGASTDDELRKRMIAGAVDGDRFQCLDNITGHFKSSVLAAVVTGGRVGDRILGQSRTVKAQVRSLLTMTGNNASIDADLQRRTVQVRIDAGIKPTHRAYSFCPVAEALEHRREIAEAACLLLRAYFSAGAPDIVKGDAGGFAAWNRLCRQPVLWLAREGLADGLPWKLGDPAASMLADASASDPELEATGDLLRALWEITDGADFTAAEVVKWQGLGDGGSADSPFALLRSAVLEIIGRHDVSARSMGRTLMNRRDRAVAGFKLLNRSATRSLQHWRVVWAEG
jgi:putative DNA primase/helicase